MLFLPVYDTSSKFVLPDSHFLTAVTLMRMLRWDVCALVVADIHDTQHVAAIILFPQFRPILEGAQSPARVSRNSDILVVGDLYHLPWLLIYRAFTFLKCNGDLLPTLRRSLLRFGIIFRDAILILMETLVLAVDTLGIVIIQL